MSDDVIITDATIIERVEAGSPLDKPRMRLPEVLLWTVMSVAWYAALRLIVVGAFAVPWLALGHSAGAASGWATVGAPTAVAFAAFLTMQTNTRNRELHFVMTCVIFLSAVLFHVDFGLGNPFADKLPGGVRALAWAFQTVAALVGAAAGLALVRRRRAKRAQEQPALPSSS